MQNKKIFIIIGAVLLLLCCCVAGGITFVLLFFTPQNKSTNTSQDDLVTTTTQQEVTSIADPFDNNKNEWLEDSIENEFGIVTRKIAGGKYIWEMDAIKQISKSVLPKGLGSLEDGEISFDGRVVNAEAEAVYGLLFRYTDAKNYYTVRISEKVKMYSLVAMVEGVPTSLVAWTENAAIKTTGNNLKVNFIGTTIKIYVNNVLVKEITDDTFSEGWYCLNAEFYGVNQTAKFEFDNFNIAKK